MWYRDPFLIFLTGLLVLLLSKQACLFFKEEGLKGRGRLYPFFSCMAACFSLFSVSSYFQAFWLGVYLVCINWRGARLPSLPYSMVALLLFGLFPSFWTVCLVMPVLFWPSLFWMRPETSFGGNEKDVLSFGQSGGMGTPYILAIGYAFKNVAHDDPFMCFVGIMVLAFLVLIWSFYKYSDLFLSFLTEFCALTRSLLLVMILHIALHMSLYGCAEAALCALLLDVTCRVGAAWSLQWRSLILAFPPLPGFAILWFGIHAALLLAGPHTSWTLLGLGLGLVIGLLSIIETILVVVTLPPVRIDGSFIMIAALPSFILPFIAFSIAPHIEGVMFPHYGGISQWFRLWYESETGRSFLFQPLLWLLWVMIWFSCVNPRLKWRKPPAFLSCPVAAKTKLDEVFCLSHAQFFKPHDSLARQVIFLKGQGKAIRLSLSEWWEGRPDISLFVWLCALAFLFLMIGLSS